MGSHVGLGFGARAKENHLVNLHVAFHRFWLIRGEVKRSHRLLHDIGVYPSHSSRVSSTQSAETDVVDVTGNTPGEQCNQFEGTRGKERIAMVAGQP